MASTRICLLLYTSKHIWLTLSLILHEKDNALPNYPGKSVRGIHVFSLLLQSNKLLPTTEKRTIIESKQDLERKLNGFFPQKTFLSFKIWKANTAAVLPSLKAKPVPVSKWYHYAVLIVYTLLFFGFYFVPFVVEEGEWFVFHSLWHTFGRCTCTFMSGDTDLSPQSS